MNTARINLVLALLVAALGAIALFAPRPGTDPSSTPLTRLDPMSIQRVSLQRADETLEFTRSRAGWRLGREPADTDKLSALCRIAGTRSLRQFAANEASAPELGLAPPQLALDMDGLRLEFGGTDPIQQRRYVRIGDTVHLIEDRHHQLLLAPAASYLAE